MNQDGHVCYHCRHSASQRTKRPALLAIFITKNDCSMKLGNHWGNLANGRSTHMHGHCQWAPPIFKPLSMDVKKKKSINDLIFKRIGQIKVHCHKEMPYKLGFVKNGYPCHVFHMLLCNSCNVVTTFLANFVTTCDSVDQQDI